MSRLQRSSSLHLIQLHLNEAAFGDSKPNPTEAVPNSQISLMQIVRERLALSPLSNSGLHSQALGLPEWFLHVLPVLA